MKYRSTVLEGPRNPGRWPVLRKPPKPHAREDSRLRAMARRPSPPRPQRGLDAVNARRLRQSRDRPPCLQDLVLWRKPRNPPSIATCALDPGVDATAAAQSELRSRLPFTVVHRTVHRPQHLHGISPSTLDARVPAIQRPSARSYRTVDNSLITSRIEYSTFLNLPHDEYIVNTPQMN